MPSDTNILIFKKSFAGMVSVKAKDEKEVIGNLVIGTLIRKETFKEFLFWNAWLCYYNFSVITSKISILWFYVQ